MANKYPTLIVSLHPKKKGDRAVDGTFMGVFEPNMVMVGTEDDISMVPLDAYHIVYIHEVESGKHCTVSTDKVEQKDARDILNHVSALMPAEGMVKS